MAVTTIVDFLGVREINIPDDEPIGFGVYAPTTIFGNLEIVSGSLTTDGFTVSGSFDVPGNLSVGGNLAVTGTFSVPGNLSVGVLDVVDLYTSDDLFVSGVSTFANTASFVAGVGIGGASPSDWLDETQLAVSGASVFEGEMSIGNPGFEQGSLDFAGGTFDAILKVNAFGGGFDALAVFHRHSTTDAANVLFTRARGDTSAHSPVQQNDILSRLIFAGHDGTDYNPAVWLQASVDGGVGSNDMPGRLEVYTTQDGANTPSLALNVDSNQDAYFSSNLFVSSSATIASGLTVSAGSSEISGSLRVSGSFVQRQQYGTTGAGTYNVTIADDNRLLEVDPAGGSTTIVLPSNLDVGFFFYFRQTGTGTVTVSGSSGVTVSSTAGSEPSLSAQWGHATADKRSDTQWVVAGDIA